MLIQFKLCPGAVTLYKRYEEASFFHFLNSSSFFQEAPEARHPVLGEGDPPGEGERLEPGDRDGGGEPRHP